MLESRRGRFFLKWLRNLLLTGGILCLYLGVVTALDLRQQEELSIPSPIALEDPSAAPIFNEEVSGEIIYGNCLACHREMVSPGATLAVPEDDSALQAEAARIRETIAARRAKERVADDPAVVGQFEQSLEMPTTTPSPTPGPTPGVPVRLAIPSLNIDSTVTAVSAKLQDSRTVWEVPRDVIGWYQATALAGAKGNTVMSGHVAQREGLGVFRDLYQIHVGDPVYVETANDRLTYFVREVRIVLPNEIGYLQPTPDATLTLITCAGRYDAATRTFSHRLIVIAKPAANV